MRQRGKASSASLQVVRSEVEAIQRLDIPAQLTKEQAAVWVDIVNRMPADWLQKESEGLLTQYCRHVGTCDQVARMIRDYEESSDFDIAEYDRLLKMQERESRAMSSLATRMRLTPQSTIANKRKSKDAKPKPPWES